MGEVLFVIVFFVAFPFFGKDKIWPSILDYLPSVRLLPHLFCLDSFDFLIITFLLFLFESNRLRVCFSDILIFFVDNERFLIKPGKIN